ncbi:MAG: amidophosphoribosyltransferase [Bacteroidetes bacterium]|nr:amidophosphoribosyltransferase [Bacteroidota bacterium]
MCGIAFIRLLKPLEYYLATYGTSFYGLNKLHLLMQKQHNRGQDGAGMACIKFDIEPGNSYIDRFRSNADAPIKDVFGRIYEQIDHIRETNPKRLNDTGWLKYHVPFTGELFLGHLRYGTYGKNNIENLHPLIRENNWITRNLVLAGNFNLTNVDELFHRLIELGQYPVQTSDTITILEKIGHFLDEENEILYRRFKAQGYSKKDISHLIARDLDIQSVLRGSSENWDGGYVLAGLLGHGDAFVLRDPNGIRPAFYYKDDEVIVAASERPVIQTTFNVPASNIHEILPGHALIIKKNGLAEERPILHPKEKSACSFERIYFSRGTDIEIYQERKNLGRFLMPAILRTIDYDLKNTVFSYIPNTAASAFYGLIEALNEFCDDIRKEKILRLKDQLTPESLSEILSIHPHMEKVAVKDMKLRTFITEDTHRDDLTTHIYDITYGTVRKDIDNLVVIDDSIVRGTTLRQSIIRILSRLEPKRIIIASSAPQIRYPDCYGIDMAKLSDFIAFKAVIELLYDTRQTDLIAEVYRKCKEQENMPKEQVVNHVWEIYRSFPAERIAEKIAVMVKPRDCKADLKIIFQTIEDLHRACPDHRGDWYFTGDYPTPGGYKVAIKSFINYIERKDERAYH